MDKPCAQWWILEGLPRARCHTTFHGVLVPLVGKRFKYRELVRFHQQGKALVLEDTDMVVSFDVRSFFTSVPVDVAVETCKLRLDDDNSWQDRTHLNAVQLCRLLRFCLANTYFTDHGNFYEQMFGTAVGAATSVTTAIESKALPKAFLRYVDDCFCVRGPRALSLPLNRALMLLSRKSCFPFIDTTVTRAPTGLTLGVYGKPAHSARYLQ